MNNFDEKIITIEKMMDDCEEKIQNLNSKHCRLEERDFDLNEDLEKLERLTYLPFNKKDKKINLKNRMGLFLGLIGICGGILALSTIIGGGSIIYIICSLIVKTPGLIIENNLLLILFASIVSFVVGMFGTIESSAKLELYNDLRLLNNRLFSDNIYSKERIETKEEIINKKRQSLVHEHQQISEKINEIYQEYDSLEILLNEVESYKASFDDVINQIYDKNISTDLKEKLEKTLVKVKKW